MATFAGNIRSIWATVLRVPFARHIFSNFRTICKVGVPRITDKELWVQGHTVSKRQRPDLNPVFLMTEMSGPPHTRLLDTALIKPHSLTPSARWAPPQPRIHLVKSCFLQDWQILGHWYMNECGLTSYQGSLGCLERGPLFLPPVATVFPTSPSHICLCPSNLAFTCAFSV